MALFKGTGDNFPQFVIIPWFCQGTVYLAPIYRLNGDVKIGFPREQDPDRSGPVYLNQNQKIGTLYPRHALIGDHDINILFTHDAQGIFSAQCGDDVVALITQSARKGRKNRRFVVDYHYGVFHV